MLKLTVVNNGKRTRHRLGVGFKPKEKTEIEVTAKEYITIKAVKDFEIVEKVDTRAKENHKEDLVNPKEIFQALTVDNAIEYVKEGNISIDEAIEYELHGKSRRTLIETLEDMKEGE